MLRASAEGEHVQSLAEEEPVHERVAEHRDPHGRLAAWLGHGTGETAGEGSGDRGQPDVRFLRNACGRPHRDGACAERLRQGPS